MKKILVQLTCRYCLYQTHKESETLILPDIERDLKKQLLQGTYFSAHCPCCGRKITFMHTCLYVDKNNGYMLYMKPINDRKADDHLQFEDHITIRRYIAHPKQIAEKIRILDDHFDDRIIEIIKQQLYGHVRKNTQDVQEIMYHDYDEQSQTLWFNIMQGSDLQQIAITMDTYKRILKQHIFPVTSQFVEVNESWAKAYLLNI